MSARPLAVELDHLDGLLRCAILRLRTTYELSLDEFRGLYVSDEQVDALLRAQIRAGYEPAPPIPAPEPRSAWAALAAELALEPAERGLVLMALAPELDRKYETLFAYLNNDVTRRWPTADLALRVLGDGPALRRALLPDSRLFAQGLLELAGATAERRPERLCEIAASVTVARYVQGLPLPLPQAARRVSGMRGGGAASLPQMGGGRAPLLLLEGEPGAGRLSAARTLAGGGDVLVVDGAAVPVDGWADLARALGLVARLERAVLYLDTDGLEGKPPPGMVAALATWSERIGHPVCVALTPGHPLHQVLRELPGLRVPLAEPDRAARRALWVASLNALGVSATPDTLDALADRFRLTPRQIAYASRAAALAQDGAGPELAPEALFRAARERSGTALHGLATRVRPRAGWPDLVLPAITLARLREVTSAIAHRELVQHGWGMARLSAAPGGLAVLFQGPPGTGKTMAASVIADGLGLDLYRVDLATVVSKYIGETEKNLDRIFSAARGSNAVLLFDEADALFGRRSEVKDAHDRYANLEVAYLLQRMEEHDGPVILATNLAKNMDQAFTRRLHYVVDFPRPDMAAREALWRAMLRPPLPCAADLDHAFLARTFELTGGEIRKAALEAAFMAAADGHVVGMPMLVQALTREAARQGRMVPAASLQGYAELAWAAV